MPRIFDNIDSSLLPALRDAIAVSERADFCVGYFNLRGWRTIDDLIERWSGDDGACCRLLIGMQKLEEAELRTALAIGQREEGIDNGTAIRLKRALARQFRDQLAYGAPTNADESGLRRLAKQLRSKKVIVKLYLAHSLHAKLYLAFRSDRVSPAVGFVGSSNLTLAGLSRQGELNVDVLDHDATGKLAQWFDNRWDDRWCFDISQELIEIIEQSWAREPLVPPYHIFVKMAYHLAEEARNGLVEFHIPKQFEGTLFEFQTAAVKIAARHLNNRGGVLFGDVVGLGKTLMATALARMFEDDLDLETLIICPPNLVKMWEHYRERYGLRGKVLSLSQVLRTLPELRAYRIVLIDESHNLRNREGRRYNVIQEYIERSSSKVVLLSATPYNKSFEDLSSQLRLFVPDDLDLGVAPEALIRETGEAEFLRKYQCSPKSILAFEKSTHVDDWRELMRLYLVRRTRSFIQENYAKTDKKTGRKYLTLADGSPSFFPTREPRNVRFDVDEGDPEDQYAQLYSSDVVEKIRRLTLARYGLGSDRYLLKHPTPPPTTEEKRILDDLSRAGGRLIGFCKTNLFKRLESNGCVFLLSLQRHVLRNELFMYAIENSLPLPIGRTDLSVFDAGTTDRDADDPDLLADTDDGEGGAPAHALHDGAPRSAAQFRQQAKELYEFYYSHDRSKFKWITPRLFSATLRADLAKDSEVLRGVLTRSGSWDVARDAKLSALVNLLTKKHPTEKVLVFSQFSDTVDYLERELARRGVRGFGAVTGDSHDPTGMAWRFSPQSNGKAGAVRPEEELRILLATDVLSEGQNLQDAAIVVNFDLPWAIIRLIQRAGRVDRIGQHAATITCYSFLPAEGVDKIINLRERVRQRLSENAAVVGTDEAFFEDDRNDQAIRDLFTEKAGIYDGDADTEIDLTSYAYQIWQNAIDADPSLQETIENMPPVVYATRNHAASSEQPDGAIVYVRTAHENDALAWVDREGRIVTQSQYAILKAVECGPDEPARPRLDEHHELVRHGVAAIAADEKGHGGQLGRPSSARRRAYERLSRLQGQLFFTGEVEKAVDEIYRYPLLPSAADTLNRQMRAGISDDDLARLIVTLRLDGRLCKIPEVERSSEPQIICSMGMRGVAR